MGDSMSSDVQREEWMTQELEEKIKQIAQNNNLSCTEIQQFAKEHGLEITKMKSFLDVIGLKPVNCQALCP
jgi:UV DNA damage repair endonuclease